jgi:hypothetical protein
LDDHSSADRVTTAVKLPTRASGLKFPVVVSAARRRMADLTTRGPYSALLRVGLAIPFLLPRPWWALTPPFHHHSGYVIGKPLTPKQTLLCGAFPGVAPAGRYPAPFLHGVRTFLEAYAPRSSSHPREPGHRRNARRVQAFSAAARIRRATASARARSSGASGPCAQGRNRSRNAASRAAGSATG